jgi:hypothetical protein
MPPTKEGSVEKATFRSITPVFEFALDPDNSVFSHVGCFENADYEITLKRFPQGPESFNELMKYANNKEGADPDN